jgi:dTMP kinase
VVGQAQAGAERGGKGLFITFEGGEGAGKSTHAALLARRLDQRGHDVLVLREPGGTPVGDYLRTWLKSSTHPLTPEAELLLFAAARAELVRTVLHPALAEGKTVVLDRYADSTTIYQGRGRGMDRRMVAAVNRLATGGLSPDLTVLMDLPPEVGLDRAGARDGEDHERRFENADLAFHHRVRRGFLQLARQDPLRWAVVHATRPVEAVAEDNWDRVEDLLPRGSRAC